MEQNIYKAVIAGAIGIAIGCTIWLTFPAPYRGYILIAGISLAVLFVLFSKDKVV